MSFIKQKFDQTRMQQAQRFPGAPGTATPQQKVLAVAKKLGIQGIADMQATTRTIYDSLPVDGRSVYDFFQGCNARVFPFTNLSSNKLDVGEFMVVERMSLQVLTSAAPPVITAVTPMATLSVGLYQSDFSFKVANVTTLKPITLGQMMGVSNKSSRYANHEPFEFLSDLTIPSLQDFIATMRVNFVTVTANTFLKLTLEGLGVIYAPNTPM